MRNFKLYRFSADLEVEVDTWIHSKPKEERAALKGQTVSESLHCILKEKVAEANRVITEESPTADELTRIMAPVAKAATNYNKSRQLDRLEELAALPYDEAVATYLRDQTAGGVHPGNDKNDSSVTLDVTYKTAIRPYDFFNNLQKGAMRVIKDASWLFLDNVLKYWVDQSSEERLEADGKTKKIVPGVNKDHLAPVWTELRKNLKWSNEPSKTEMKKQLATIWSWMLGDAAPKNKEIRTCDVMYLVNAATRAINKANENGQYAICGDVDFIDYIFRTAYTCRNSGVYQMKHKDAKTAANRTPETIINNKDMAEPKEKGEKHPEITGDSTSKRIEPEEEKPAKKSAKGKKSDPVESAPVEEESK